MNVTMDVVCELASEIVERQWDNDNHPKPHSYIAENGDELYIEEVQDEFNHVLDLVDRILNSEERGKNIELEQVK